mmetsp:Transcript_50819/g.145185  ORF Transcript_50819/g.145185 Transcript_50819/m.145185 type:complete len:304 (-) Transcript_50819:1504-2415(-)
MAPCPQWQRLEIPYRVRLEHGMVRRPQVPCARAIGRRLLPLHLALDVRDLQTPRHKLDLGQDPLQSVRRHLALVLLHPRQQARWLQLALHQFPQQHQKPAVRALEAQHGHGNGPLHLARARHQDGAPPGRHLLLELAQRPGAGPGHPAVAIPQPQPLQGGPPDDPLRVGAHRQHELAVVREGHLEVGRPRRQRRRGRAEAQQEVPAVLRDHGLDGGGVPEQRGDGLFGPDAQELAGAQRLGISHVAPLGPECSLAEPPGCPHKRVLAVGAELGRGRHGVDHPTAHDAVRRLGLLANAEEAVAR